KHLLRGNGEIVHDRSSTPHEWQNLARNQKHASQIRFNNVFPILICKLLHWAVGMGNAGVIDENIDASKLLFHRRSKFLHRLGRAHIAHLRHPSHAQTGEFTASLFKRWETASGNDEVTTLLGETSCDGQSYAPAGAGHDCNLAAQGRATTALDRFPGSQS